MQFLVIFRNFIDPINAEPIEKHQELFRSAISSLDIIDSIAIQEGTWEEGLRTFIELKGCNQTVDDRDGENHAA